MNHLPVFSTIGQAVAVGGLYPGKLVKWLGVPVLLSAVVAAAVVALALVVDWNAVRDSPALLAGALLASLPLMVLLLLIWVPYAMRINQLAATGDAEPGGYFEKILAAPALRYLKYAVLVGLINLAGMTVSLIPMVIAAAIGRPPRPWKP